MEYQCITPVKLDPTDVPMTFTPAHWCLAISQSIKFFSVAASVVSQDLLEPVGILLTRRKYSHAYLGLTDLALQHHSHFFRFAHVQGVDEQTFFVS
jgi:hypothetical protein